MKNLMKVSLVAIALLFGMSVNAQDKPIAFGVKAGVNLSNMGGDAKGTDAKIGFNAGVTLDYALSTDVYLMTGLGVSSKGFKMKDVELDLGSLGSFSGDVTFNPIYLELPIHIGYKVTVTENTRVVFHVGPYLAYGIAGKATVKAYGDKDDVNVFSTGSLKEFDFGFGGGVGAEFGQMGVGLGYDFGFVNVADTNGAGKLKNMNAYLSLGYKF